MTNAVTGKVQFVVTAVSNKPGSDLSEVSQEFRLAITEEGAEKESPAASHRRQTVQTAAAPEVVKERLCLVAAMMAESNRRATKTGRLFEQKSLPRHPPGLFKTDLFLRRQRRDIDPFADQRDLQLRTKGTDKVGIILALRTNTVIKMGGSEEKLKGDGNRTKKMEEGHRITAAREGDKDPFLRSDQPVSMKSLGKIVSKP